MKVLKYLIKITKENPILTIILVVGFLLRIISTTPGYYYPIGDELLPGEAINMLLKQTLALSPQYLGFPPLVPWIMLVAFSLFFIPAMSLWTLLVYWKEILLPLFALPIIVVFIVVKKLFHVNSRKLLFSSFLVLWGVLILGGIFGLTRFPILQREILGRDWIDALYWGRYLTAFVGTLVVLVTYKLTELYFNKRAALLSALFVSINYRLILNSHVALPDTYNVFFLLVTLVAIGHLLKTPTFKNYLITFMSLALFFMVKYQSHPLLPFLIVHATLSFRKISGSFLSFLRKFFRKEVMLSGILALILVLISHIYHFKNLALTSEINSYEAIKYGFGRNILDLYPVSYFYHIGIGPGLTIMSLLGIIIGLIFKKTRLSTVLLISCLPTFAFLYLYYTNGGFFTRNLISVIPIFLIFSGLSIDFLYTRFQGLTPRFKILHPPILIVFITSLLSGNIINSITTAIAYSKTAPRIEAQNWIDQNITSGVFNGFLGYPRPINEAIPSANLLPYYKAFSYQEYLDENYDYVALEISHLRDQWVWWTRQLPQTQIKFWGKPDDLLSQNYYALAFRELMWNHTQASFISPWQAPSHNISVLRVNKDATNYKKVTSIKKFTNFDESWSGLYYLPEYLDFLKKVDGENSNKLLFINSPRHLPGSLRFQSEPITIKPGHGYRIVARIKNDKMVPQEERDGFIRLDFYREALNPNILSRAVISHVSKRVYGESDWHEVVATGVAPADTNFATLGFQSDGISRSGFYLDTLEIFETNDAVKDIGNHFTIEDVQLFLPNNEGIL